MAHHHRTAAEVLATPPNTGTNRPAWVLDGPKFMPVRSGNIVSVSLDDNFLQSRVDTCSRFACIGRLMMPKGSVPWKYHDLKQALHALWKITDCRMLAIGHGFYIFQFATEEQRNEILDSSSFKLNLGTLYMQPWVPNFDPGKAATTLAKVWIRLFGLGYEYLHRSIILSLAAAFGRPIRIDTNSLDRCFGTYVKVLVEVDFSKPIDTFVLLETSTATIRVEMSMEDCPAFCTHCMALGHMTAACSRVPGAGGLNSRDVGRDANRRAAHQVPRQATRPGQRTLDPSNEQQIENNIAQPETMAAVSAQHEELAVDGAQRSSKSAPAHDELKHTEGVLQCVTPASSPTANSRTIPVVQLILNSLGPSEGLTESLPPEQSISVQQEDTEGYQVVSPKKNRPLPRRNVTKGSSSLTAGPMVTPFLSKVIAARVNKYGPLRDLENSSSTLPAPGGSSISASSGGGDNATLVPLLEAGDVQDSIELVKGQRPGPKEKMLIASKRSWFELSEEENQEAAALEVNSRSDLTVTTSTVSQ